MLEQRSLLLRPRRGDRQAIADAETARPLGFVCWSRVHEGSWWQQLVGWELAIHEQEDEPLLFTIRRTWGLTQRHEVRDADGHPVGVVIGSQVFDRRSSRLAVLSRKTRASRTFTRDDHRLLAELESCHEGLRLTFAAEAPMDPFARMLLLAAALASPS